MVESVKTRTSSIVSFVRQSAFLPIIYSCLASPYHTMVLILSRIWRLFRCGQMPSINRNTWFTPYVFWATSNISTMIPNSHIQKSFRKKNVKENIFFLLIYIDLYLILICWRLGFRVSCHFFLDSLSFS